MKRFVFQVHLLPFFHSVKKANKQEQTKENPAFKAQPEEVVL